MHTAVSAVHFDRISFKCVISDWLSCLLWLSTLCWCTNPKSVSLDMSSKKRCSSYQCLTLDIFLTAAEELQRGFQLDGQLPVRPLHPALLFSALQSEPSERDPSLSVSSWKRSSPSLHLSLPLSGTPWCSSSSYLSSLQPPLCTFCTSSLSFILQIFFFFICWAFCWSSKLTVKAAQSL